MYRQPIRNPDSDKEVKPRVCDAIIDGDDIRLEFKYAKRIEVIRLCDVLKQIEAAKRKAEEHEKENHAQQPVV